MNRLEEIHARILALPVVQFELERRAGWRSYAVDDPMAGAEAVIGELRGGNVVAGFRLHSATLEDAFIHHIGELSESFEA